MRLQEIRDTLNQVLGNEASMMEMERPVDIQAVGKAYRHVYDPNVSDGEIIDYLINVSHHEFMTYRTAQADSSPQDKLTQNTLNRYRKGHATIFTPVEVQDTDECGKYEPVQYEDIYNLA